MAQHDKRHGGPWDRGHADSYYRRRRSPHYYEVPKPGTVTSRRVESDGMTEDEVAAYHAGYNDNEKDGFYKEY